jgi:fumarylacetoacetase
MASNHLLSSGSRFTIDNIPFGVISTQEDPNPRCATAIGEFAIDLAKLAEDVRFAQVIGENQASEIFSKVFCRIYRRGVKQKIFNTAPPSSHA